MKLLRRPSWLGCLVVCWAILPGTIRAAVDEPVCPIDPSCPAGGVCTGGAFPGVLNQICSLAFGGTCIERCDCCVTEQTELFAGVTFGPPVSLTPKWPGIGGRGQLEAEAALCLLRDLGNTAGGSGVLNEAQVSIGPLGDAKVKQRVALVDFDPVARTMEGFHAVSICAPPFGCIDDQVQSFSAVLVHSLAGSFACGDYPFDESYGLDITTSDTEHRLSLDLQAIEIYTPYGKVSAHPKFRYRTAMKSGYPVGVNELRIPDPSCSEGTEVGTAISSVVTLADGASGTALLCALMPPPPPPEVAGQGYGLVSQLGLGGRGVSEDEPLYSTSPRPDLDLFLPRTSDERKAVGSVAADVKFAYSFADLLPDQFNTSPFHLTAEAFVTPMLDVGFASQFQIHFTDALYRTLVLSPDCHVYQNGDTRVVLQSLARSHVSFDIDAGLNLVLTLSGISTPFGKISVTVLEKHPKFAILPEPVEGDDDDGGPDAEATFQWDPEPAFSSLTPFSTNGTPVADPTAFRNACFQTPPPDGQTLPTPTFTPDDPQKFTTVLEFPCNVCFSSGALTQGCGRASSEFPEDWCAIDENGVCCAKNAIDENGVCYEPLNQGCQFWPISPSDIPAGSANEVDVLFPAPQDPSDQWFCDSVEKSGCMDLCTYDPTALQPLQVVQSAVDLDPDRCGGSVAQGRPCGTDAQCDDGNPCTGDHCVFGGEFGTCSYTALDVACDDGLFCNGSDRCALGACAVHDGNPCATAGGCCEETSDTCVPECPLPLPRCGNGILQSGEQCDDGNTISGDGCSATCEIERETLDCGDAAASMTELWPPNHQFAEVSVVGVTDPTGAPVSITVTGITQDEPLLGQGDGNTCPDGLGVGTPTARLRAERAGTPSLPGDGRVYHVSFTATSGSAGQCTGTVTVCVPHDQRPGHACVDGGALVDSTGPCP